MKPILTSLQNMLDVFISGGALVLLLLLFCMLMIDKQEPPRLLIYLTLTGMIYSTARLAWKVMR